MIRITDINIQRFRSILNMSLSIDPSTNLVAICGQNNVGKTNTLRALRIFFNPEDYEPKSDIPTLKNATWGGAVHPKITIEFLDEKENRYYQIIRDFKSYGTDESSLQGISYTGSSKRKTNKQTLDKETAKSFISKIEFIYIKSINTIIPDIIDKITQDIISLEYDKARFTSTKQNLRNAYNTYIDGLQEILNLFANEISNTFISFRETWSIALEIPKNSETFRDLISDDVSLTIKDQGSSGIVEKGSGLQRLAHILLQFEIANRLPKTKHAIIVIDEPDIYLHEGLQIKLKNFIDENSSNLQVFYSTHSKVFINTYQMKNTFLLASKIYSQHVSRKNREIDVTETYQLDTNSEEGYKYICQHLGIEEKHYEILETINIMVEGGCDKKYLEELSKFFNFNEINIISANGADNIIKYLEFYESYYRSSETYVPIIKVIFDNDSKGRDTYKRIAAKKFIYINVKPIFIPNYLNDANMNLEKNNTNNEIEDFIYPEIFCHLVNELLQKKHMNCISSTELNKKISHKSFRSNGILNLCEHEKNNVNPENGNEISFVSSGESTNRIKEGLASMFSVEGNLNLITLLNDCNVKYPNVKEVLQKLIYQDFVN